MRKWALRILVVALLVVLALALRIRERLPTTPEETVSRFLQAASEGDDRTYLRLDTGPLRESLEDARGQAGADAFCESLRRSTAGLKGHAMTRLDDSPSGPVALDVTLVFADRNEVQTIRLEPKSGGWVIASIGAARTVKPSVPYGTPVFEAPEPGPAEAEPADDAPQDT